MVSIMNRTMIMKIVKPKICFSFKCSDPTQDPVAMRPKYWDPTKKKKFLV